MITFQVDRTIARPRAEVFERLADVGAYGSWLPRSILFRGGWFATPDSNPGSGVAYDEKTPLGTFSGKIVEFEPPETIAFVTPMILMGRRVFESRPRYVLCETDHATVVHHFAEASSTGRGGCSSPLGYDLPATNGPASWTSWRSPFRPRPTEPQPWQAGPLTSNPRNTNHQIAGDLRGFRTAGVRVSAPLHRPIL